MPRSTGRVTLPIQERIDDQLRELVALLGADAVRNSDGTDLPAIASELVDTVYSTYFPSRGDQDVALTHPETLINQHLMSERVTSPGTQPLVTNNARRAVRTTVRGQGRTRVLEIGAMGCPWVDVEPQQAG